MEEPRAGFAVTDAASVLPPVSMAGLGQLWARKDSTDGLLGGDLMAVVVLLLI
jgi:hypothetical protein